MRSLLSPIKTTVSFTVLSGDDGEAPKVFTGTVGESITIGRASKTSGPTPARDNGLFRNQVLSRQHATIEWRKDGIYIKDLKSTHGTHIKDHPLPVSQVWKRLNNGDIVTFGKIITRPDEETQAQKAYEPLVVRISIIPDGTEKTTTDSSGRRAALRRLALSTEDQLGSDDDENATQMETSDSGLPARSFFSAESTTIGEDAETGRLLSRAFVKASSLASINVDEEAALSAESSIVPLSSMSKPREARKSTPILISDHSRSSSVELPSPGQRVSSFHDVVPPHREPGSSVLYAELSTVELGPASSIPEAARDIEEDSSEDDEEHQDEKVIPSSQPDSIPPVDPYNEEFYEDEEIEDDEEIDEVEDLDMDAGFEDDNVIACPVTAADVADSDNEETHEDDNDLEEVDGERATSEPDGAEVEIDSSMEEAAVVKDDNAESDEEGEVESLQSDNEAEKAVDDEEEENDEEEDDAEVSEDSSQIFDTSPMKISGNKSDRSASFSSNLSDDEPVQKKMRAAKTDSAEEGSSTSLKDTDLKKLGFGGLQSDLADLVSNSAPFFLHADGLPMIGSDGRPINALQAKNFKKPKRDASTQIEAIRKTSSGSQTLVQSKDAQVQSESESEMNGEVETSGRKRTYDTMVHDAVQVSPAFEELRTYPDKTDREPRPKKGLPWRAAAKYTGAMALGAIAAIVGLATLPEID